MVSPRICIAQHLLIKTSQVVLRCCGQCLRVHHRADIASRAQGCGLWMMRLSGEAGCAGSAWGGCAGRMGCLQFDATARLVGGGTYAALSPASRAATELEYVRKRTQVSALLLHHAIPFKPHLLLNRAD